MANPCSFLSVPISKTKPAPKATNFHLDNTDGVHTMNVDLHLDLDLGAECMAGNVGLGLPTQIQMDVATVTKMIGTYSEYQDGKYFSIGCVSLCSKFKLKIIIA